MKACDSMHLGFEYDCVIFFPLDYLQSTAAIWFSFWEKKPSAE